MKYLEIFGRNFIFVIIAAIAIYSIFLIVSDINKLLASVVERHNSNSEKPQPLDYVTLEADGGKF